MGTLFVGRASFSGWTIFAEKTPCDLFLKLWDTLRTKFLGTPMSGPSKKPTILSLLIFKASVAFYGVPFFPPASTRPASVLSAWLFLTTLAKAPRSAVAIIEAHISRANCSNAPPCKLPRKPAPHVMKSRLVVPKASSIPDGRCETGRCKLTRYQPLPHVDRRKLSMSGRLRLHRNIGSVLRIQFFHHVANMNFHSAFAYTEFISDELVRLAPLDRTNHGEFAM